MDLMYRAKDRSTTDSTSTKENSIKEQQNTKTEGRRLLEELLKVRWPVAPDIPSHEQ